MQGPPSLPALPAGKGPPADTHIQITRMKRYATGFLSFLAAGMLLLSACSRHGEDEWESFKRKYASHGTTIRLNGLMRTGLQIAAAAEDDPETHALMDILKKMKGVEIHIIPAASAHFSAGEVSRLSEVLNHSRYESLINVRKGDQMVNLWARGGENDFSDPLVLVHSGSEVVMVEMKGTLTASDLQTLSQAGMKYVH